MHSLASDIQRIRVPKGAVALWWLAQAGFVFKTVRSTVLYLDPYLSDVVEKAFGFKRLALAPIDAEAVQADWLISSHEHLDHLDTDALPVIARNNPGCRFAGSESCMPEYDKIGIPADKQLLLKPEETYELSDVRIMTARADHGTLSPSALSLLLDFGEVRVMFTGDTALNIPWMQPLIDQKPDILVPCINGRFGNLNPEEAAELTALVKPRAVTPCHFWMFKEHNGDPEAFVQACVSRCPEVPVWLLRPGEGFICTKRSIEVLL
ncbi:MAG TPA: MBL fold metallo-hydrolase [Candidatus Hydrogenedentes bacterium]|nr:MBL fold metallo-hydrolase [Candidatus Hydrogenedentota bacterium]